MSLDSLIKKVLYTGYIYLEAQMNCVESYATFKLSHDSAAWKYMYCIFILCAY